MPAKRSPAKTRDQHEAHLRRHSAKTAASPASKSAGRGADRDVARFLAALPDEQRKALEKLRRSIRAIVPRAQECMSYGIPAFRLDGKVLVCFGASARHCAFYPGSGTAVAAHASELAGYSTSKGTIRFQPNQPLPAALLRKLIKYRLAENAAKRAG